MKGVTARLVARYAGAGAASLAYLGASRWLTLSAPASHWNHVALLTPLLLAATLLAWRARQRGWSCAALLVLAALMLHAALGGEFSVRSVYACEHIGAHLFLAAWFGRTLRRGAQPLITLLATRIHGPLDAARLRYTRRVTQAWTLYFAAMALLSLGLYLFASFERWVFFASLLTPAALVAMFVGEHLLRYRLHPEFERASMLDSIRAYRQRGAAAPAIRKTP